MYARNVLTFALFLLQLYLKFNASDILVHLPNRTYYDHKECVPKENSAEHEARKKRQAVNIIRNDNKWLVVINETYTVPPAIFVGIDVIGT